MSSTLFDKKFEYWTHQLLDLGKRNKMINYRETKRSTLKLLEPAFEDLYHRLVINEETLTFQRAVDRETDIRVFSILSLLENLSSPLPVTIGDIKTEGSILDRQKTLKNIRSKARLSLEEQGTNILYLSFGFIEWKDGKGASAKWIKSPLILVPTVLALDSLNSPYTLSKHEDDVVVNPTLQYYFKTEYGIELPNFDSDKDTLSEYLESIEKIADQRGWRILREVSLGLLSFLKISMYNDLVRNEQRIKTNPVIRAMSGDAADANNIPARLHAFDLDSIRTQDCYQVMSADSSQQDAILYSKNNVSFVMQGPPGTGKSQTITNIIAEALADGKKVLFVSEKMAALQVVYRRLQDAHLAEFCLPLHSYKANKKEILEQIGANLQLKQTRVKDTALHNLEELLSIRRELNQYATELHQLNPEINLSVYEVYSKLEAVKDAKTVTFIIPSPLAVTTSQLQDYLNKIKEYSLALQRIDYQIYDNPWDGLLSRTTGYEYIEKMRRELSFLRDKLSHIVSEYEKIPEYTEWQYSVYYSAIQRDAELIRMACDFPNVPECWLNGNNIELLLSEAEKAQEQYKDLFSFEKQISNVFNFGIYDYDYLAWYVNMDQTSKILMSLPYAKEEASYYMDNAELIYQQCAYVKSLLEEVNRTYELINQLLGTQFKVNGNHQQILSQLYELIKKNEVLVAIWFSEDIPQIYQIIEEAKIKAAQLNETKSKILENWETDILSLDYAPMLLRYKTEYTSFLKIFKSQYRTDRKQLQALSRKVIKKIPDEMASNLLLTLKDYHEQLAWFDDQKEKLEVFLAGYYNGINTNWNDALLALNTVKSIKELPVQCISEALIELLSADHMEQINSLGAYLQTAAQYLSQINEAITVGTLKLDLADTDFDGTVCVSILESYLENLSIAIDGFTDIQPCLQNRDTSFETICNTIETIKVCTLLSEQITQNKIQHEQKFESFFKGRETNWEEIFFLLNKLKEIEQVRLFRIYDAIKTIINTDCSRKMKLKEIVSEIERLRDDANSSFEWVGSQFDKKSFNELIALSTLVDKISKCLDTLHLLERWIDYQEAKEDCIQSDLANFIEEIEAKNILTDIERVFLKGFYQMWIGAISEKSAAVRRFRRNTHDERIKKFAELDDLQLLIAQMRIRERLIEGLPSDHHFLKATDEVAILKKELSKKRNIMPLRKLFKLIPNLLLKLKPCLMMSPLSVSYFLETEAYHFDLVIFDEASQIFPEDAIGAIFRGSQVIIAGDSKQLPPTNFFSASTNNFDGDYDITDEDDYSEVASDSILEEAAAVLPNRTLLWHYRSKHESLIAFSNQEIYNNNLITFPNSVTTVPNMGVEYIYVEDGCYDRGGKKNNVKEARECVRLVFEHIKTHPERSLGIIAFSESQQATIENAIIDYRERNPQYEWFFDESKDEPFFVKNLENVQGDERDTIIFSICYGKDKNGTMYMNFGPVGHNGGERRLNVAITRAKCNIKLVGSILPSDIDITRAKSEGARMLRSYIEYAMKGTSVLKTKNKDDEFDDGDDFCAIIVSFLQAHGYTVETEVGCSDYKIDIAVVNPNVEGEYIAGIECDGLSYVHAKTARDRDHLRQTILRNMGWNMYRVWSTEWIRNPVAEGNALLNYLRSIVDREGNALHAVKQSNANSSDFSIDNICSETIKQQPKQSLDNPYGFKYYEEAYVHWWELPSYTSNDNLAHIGEIIKAIVSVEQPMHMELLYKRMGPYFSAGRATEAVRNTVDEAVNKKLKKQVKIDDERFIRLVPETPVEVRIPNRYEPPRPMEYIHTEEVAAAMTKIIDSSYGITTEDLSSECARAFGFERKGPKIKMKTDAAIQYLKDNEAIRIIDGKVSLA